MQNENNNLYSKAKLIPRKIGLKSLFLPLAVLFIILSVISLAGLSCATGSISSAANAGNTNNTAVVSSQIQDDNNSEKVFTAEELAKYNGQDGMPAYVAVDGLVYDLSRIFRDGIHFEHFAGQELTDAFYSYHAKREIMKYPVVGTYQP
jgi:predicted heme/steroid binding protein